MNILLVGALSWNPERVRSLCERGDRLWGLWSRTMSWEQGPYAALDGCVRSIDLADAVRTIRDDRIDCVYSLLQVYEPSRWGPAPPGVEHDVWTLLRVLLDERSRGAIDLPFVRHWGSDIHNIDPAVVRAFDAQIFANREKVIRWTNPPERGGLGLDVVSDGGAVDVLDADRPKQEFMTDDFADRLSDATGEIHTVCVGRPLGIDFLAAARNEIHVHLYGNDYDDVSRALARSTSLRSPLPKGLLARFVHLHPPLQAIGADWGAVQRTKRRWVPEFSQYDAGWSYVGDFYPSAPLEDHAAIPNRLGTYLLAGLPVITDIRPGAYRYEEPFRLGVGVRFATGDYAQLREALAAEIATRDAARRAIDLRHEFSFDASIGALEAILQRASEAYFSKGEAERRRFVGGEPRLVRLGTPVPRRSVAHRTRARVRSALVGARAARIARLLDGERVASRRGSP